MKNGVQRERERKENIRLGYFYVTTIVYKEDEEKEQRKENKTRKLSKGRKRKREELRREANERR